MNKPAIKLMKQSFLSVALSKEVVIRAIKVAFIVGTALAFINHGGKILNMSVSVQDCLKIIFTYLVPYGVSTWSAVGAIRANTSNTT